LVHGHFRDELHGLASHPLRQECITCGDDKVLRVWDLLQHRQVANVVLVDIARCAAYNPNGQIFAVGLGGTVKGSDRPNPREHSGEIVIASYIQVFMSFYNSIE
jgi:WD40 repeat protein